MDPFFYIQNDKIINFDETKFSQGIYIVYYLDGKLNRQVFCLRNFNDNFISDRIVFFTNIHRDYSLSVKHLGDYPDEPCVWLDLNRLDSRIDYGYQVR